MRKLPANVEYFLRLARKARLTNPLGRALYAHNRVLNGGVNSPCPKDPHPNREQPTDEWYVTQLLRPTKPETAARWLAHWKKGNSLKSLKWGRHGRMPKEMSRRLLQDHDRLWPTYRNEWLALPYETRKQTRFILWAYQKEADAKKQPTASNEAS